MTRSWGSIIDIAKKHEQHEKRIEYLKLHNIRAQFCEGDDFMHELEFDPDHCTMSINQPGLEGWDYDEIPWDEEEEEDIPWWEMPDIDEDDELTALCKKVMKAGDYDKRRRAEKIEANVITFAVNLKNKWLKHKNNNTNDAGDGANNSDNKAEKQAQPEERKATNESIAVNTTIEEKKIERTTTTTTNNKVEPTSSSLLMMDDLKPPQLVKSVSAPYETNNNKITTTSDDNTNNNDISFKKPDWVTSPVKLRRTKSGDKLRKMGNLARPITPATFESNSAHCRLERI